MKPQSLSVIVAFILMFIMSLPKWVRDVFLLLAVISSTRATVMANIAKTPATNVYHGTMVVDEHRWLEDASSVEVTNWTREQRARTRAVLDATPFHAPLLRRLGELYRAASPSYNSLRFAGGRLFALKHQPPAEQQVLVMLESADDLKSERLIVDPNALGHQGTTSINLHAPSPDGKLAAVSLTEGGSEEGTLYVYETSSRLRLTERIPRAVYPSGGGCVAWKKDSSGFFYTRYPREGERPPADLNFFEQVYFHQIGAPESQDAYVIGKEFPRIAEVFMKVMSNGLLLVTVQNGDGGDFAHYVVQVGQSSTQIARFEDGVKAIACGAENELYLYSKKRAPRGKILRLNPGEFDLDKAQLLVPESEAAIHGWTWLGSEILPRFFREGDSLFVIDIIGGPSQMRVFDLAGRLKTKIPVLPISSLDEVIPLSGKGEVLFKNVSFTQPAAWYQYDVARGETRQTGLSEASPLRFDDVEVLREYAVSKDGTRVPLSIIRLQRTKLDGTNPTLLTGYGGYGITLAPHFLSPEIRLWLDAGGVYAVANLRGGGEFGEQWHKEGNLTRKQNVFDDFIACAEHLISSRYTNPGKLAIQGGSNGGLLMGAVLTQRPELFRAVVAHVGIFDMLRVELEPNGSFNVPEFGSVNDPEQFRALYAYSPYHNIKDRTPYPAVLFVTGENDRRVNPLNSRKMAARLQAATSSDRPILLRTSGTSGHGYGTALSEKIEEAADVLAFLFDQLAVHNQ